MTDELEARRHQKAETIARGPAAFTAAGAQLNENAVTVAPALAEMSQRLSEIARLLRDGEREATP